MHIIQRKIIDKLTYADKLRYSQIRPERTESNLFAYHLKQLIKDGYLNKIDKYYQLAPKGKFYVDRLSLSSLKTRQQPKIVTLIDISNSKGQNLIYRRPHQPYIGMLGFPSGKIHLDEPIMEAAKREVREKLHIKSPELHHRGMVYLSILENDILISQILAHVFTGVSEVEFDTHDPLNKQRFWGKYKDYQASEFIPGYEEIIGMINSSQVLFFDELRFNIRSKS